MTTIGVDQYTKYLKWKDTDFKLKIWDTAGQERFSALTTNFLKPIDSMCLVFAFDSMESLEQTCKWKTSIKQVKDMPYVLVGNKSDLPNKVVQPEDIQTKQKEFQCNYFEVSAYTGKGIQNAINEIVFECLRPVDQFVKKFEAELKQSVDDQGSSEKNTFFDIKDNTEESTPLAPVRKLTLGVSASVNVRRREVEATQTMSNFQWKLAQQICNQMTFEENLKHKPCEMSVEQFQESLLPSTVQQPIELGKTNDKPKKSGCRC